MGAADGTFCRRGGPFAELPERLDDYVGEDNPMRVVDVFVDNLDLTVLGFDRAIAQPTGRPGYHPRVVVPTIAAILSSYTGNAMTKPSTHGAPLSGNPGVTSCVTIPAPMAMGLHTACPGRRDMFDQQRRWCYGNANTDDNMGVRRGRANERCGGETKAGDLGLFMTDRFINCCSSVIPRRNASWATFQPPPH